MKTTFTFFAIFFFLLCCSQVARAHNGSLAGTVLDAETRQPVMGAQVTLVEKGRSSGTDALGGFRFRELATGNYSVKVTFIGFETQTLTAQVRDNETTTLAVELYPHVLQLSEVTVEAPTPGQVNTLSAIDVKLRPVNTSQDLLRQVPGLYIAQHAGGGKAEQIFLRGFDIDHGTDIRLTVDGMPVNMVSHAHGQGYADLHFLIPETVGSMDFTKGPYQASSGNFATAGQVEFSTRRSLEKSRIKLEGGQFGTGRALAMIDLLGAKGQANRQYAYAASEYFFSNGYFQHSQNFKRLNLFGKFTQYLDDNRVLSVSLSNFRSSWDASGQIPLRAIERGLISRFGALDSTEGGQTSRTNLNLQYLQMLTDQAVIKHQFYLTDYRFELYSNFTFNLNDSVNGDQIRQRENRQILGYHNSYSRQDELGSMRLTSEVGTGLRYDQVADLELSHTKARRITLDPLAKGEVEELNASAYLEETLALTPSLSLNAGVRADHFKFRYVNELDTVYAARSRSRTIASPKLNLYLTVNPSVRLFANYGAGFHSNDSRVSVLPQGRESLPRAHGSEIGSQFKPTGKVVVTTSLWQLYLAQEFVYVGDEGVVEPSGRSHRYGADLSVRYQPLEWLYADFDLTLARPRMLDAPEGERQIPLAPQLTSIGGLTAKSKNGLGSSLRYRYMDHRPANESGSVVAQGYFLLDAALNYTRERYEFGLTAENLLNRAWREAQFDTESRLPGETESVSEIHFTPGTPFFLKASASYLF